MEIKLDQFLDTPVPLLVIGIALAVIPMVVMGATPYIKFSIIFNILRNSLGIQNIPSNATTALLCLGLTIQTIYPTIKFAKDELEKINFKDKLSISELIEPANKIFDHYQVFIKKHTKNEYLEYFRELNLKNNPTFEFYLLPSYILSEVYSGLKIGFIILIPFIFIDLLVSSLLIAIGLTMLSPQTVTLPLKIGLMVSSEIWFEMIKKILSGY